MRVGIPVEKTRAGELVPTLRWRLRDDTLLHGARQDTVYSNGTFSDVGIRGASGNADDVELKGPT